ncbi:hypothetical protein L7F22_013807 [Adiantum nelumboides]|nr:hypothetical protein [Adiantum nelumboides]
MVFPDLFQFHQLAIERTCEGLACGRARWHWSRPSNEKVYFPNSLLSMKAISNYYRSPDQGDAIEFQIVMSTPVEKLGFLKERMQRYIEGLPQFWYPDFRIICDKIQDSNKMNMNIWMRHRLNFQDGGERFQRRSNMLMYLKQQLEDLGIGYHLPQQQVMVTGIPLLPSPIVA